MPYDKQQIEALAQRILIKCARKLGGVSVLATHLEVSEATLADWLSGKRVPPVEIMQKAVAPLLGSDTATGTSRIDAAARTPYDPAHE